MADVIHDVLLLEAWVGIPGTATVIAVAHDEWCPTLRTHRGPDCICRPEYFVHTTTWKKIRSRGTAA